MMLVMTTMVMMILRGAQIIESSLHIVLYCRLLGRFPPCVH